jgi:hypothetical protein
LTHCQGYTFHEVSSLPVAVINQDTIVSSQRSRPYIMIVQDTSYSMCEPIDRDAGLLTNMSSAGYDYCAASESDSKMALTASAMQQVLGGLDPINNPFYLGLTSFPGQGAACNVASGATFPLGDATTTLPMISAWYGGIVGNENGGTPTAATLSGPVASDPTLLSTDAGTSRYVLLITDGLPNCNAMNPCVFGSGQEYLWSDGIQRGCLSANWLSAIDGGNATPPSACVCAEGACPNPNPAVSVTYRNACCIVDPTVQGSGGSYPNAAAAADECLDADDAVSVIASLKAQGITTYVVGMGYDFTNASVLDRMAQAGQNDPSATHFQADHPSDLVATLQELISLLAVSCTYQLDRSPQDPRLIEVSLDGTALTLDGANGFTYTAPGNVPTVTIVGTACATIKDGANHDLKITALAQ